ncbi:hypothetical protein HDG40_000009 [Paraburkholderia sp. JPY158]|uniref:Uncharacterized protein n=1 Tax=Paraburkholderia atlantica TaxID=2654982 RepID=A0A7W8V3S9_PARAM|nr:hypothetical protein [Paraburkholderia atlantica]
MQFATPNGAFNKNARHEHSKKQTVQPKQKPRKIAILRGFLSMLTLKRYPLSATSYSY